MQKVNMYHVTIGRVEKDRIIFKNLFSNFHPTSGFLRKFLKPQGLPDRLVLNHEYYVGNCMVVVRLLPGALWMDKPSKTYKAAFRRKLKNAKKRLRRHS